MAFSRYKRTTLIGSGQGRGTSDSIQRIRSAIIDGTLSYQEILLRGSERLDTLAGSIYDDSRYWWILAAASDIGWGMQVPAGTIIRVPDISTVKNLIG